MPILKFLILCVFIIAGVAIVMWLLRKTNTVIPEPLLYVLYAALAIVCLVLLASLAGFGPIAVVW